jgi:two-component system, LytTR family, response regulator
LNKNRYLEGMIRAVIIDDEEISLKGLGEKIKTYCPDVKILKLFSKAAEAVKEIKELKPDIIFLDIEMPKMNGFTFLKNCSPIDFEVIFTTAYSEYAIEALRISALDFLLKPIDAKELVSSVQRLKEKLENSNSPHGMLEQQMQLFLQHQHSAKEPGKIALPVLNGLEFIETSTIIKVEAENVYSVFHLANSKKMVVSRTLKEVEKMLSHWNFMRVHKSFIINLNYITHYTKGEGGVVTLSDGSEVEVSRRSKHEFLARINK